MTLGKGMNFPEPRVPCVLDEDAGDTDHNRGREQGWRYVGSTRKDIFPQGQASWQGGPCQFAAPVLLWHPQGAGLPLGRLSTSLMNEENPPNRPRQEARAPDSPGEGAGASWG